MSEIQGYQPVSRIGEVVMNAFIDSYEFGALADSLNASEMYGAPGAIADGGGPTNIVEQRPMFHEWATAQPGMICLARKKKTQVFRQYVAAETAVPVIACAACLPKEKEKDYFFAGVCRSKTVRTPDDGIGPSVDEFFTLSIGGLATVLNTSGGPLHPGDLIEWCFMSDKNSKKDNNTVHVAKRLRTGGPRRVGVKMASVSSARIIGTVKSFAKNGETFDVLLCAVASASPICLVQARLPLMTSSHPSRVARAAGSSDLTGVDAFRLVCDKRSGLKGRQQKELRRSCCCIGVVLCSVASLGGGPKCVIQDARVTPNESLPHERRLCCK